jgi:hypothetical protein
MGREIASIAERAAGVSIVQRHLTSRRTLRVLREEAFRTWRAATAA